MPRDGLGIEAKRTAVSIQEVVSGRPGKAAGERYPRCDVRSGFGHGWHGALWRDPDMLTGATVDRSIMRRVWTFARPYRAMIAGLLATIVVGSIVGILPPLVFRAIIDD